MSEDKPQAAPGQPAQQSFGDAPIPPGIRELIAAYTSYQNDCPF